MSFTYHNLNTGDRYETDERDTRLDALDNWELLGAGDEGSPLVSDGILSREGMRPTSAFAEVPVVQVDADGAIVDPEGDHGADDKAPTRRSAPRK